MKVEFEDQYHVIVFLMDDSIRGIDFSSREDLEVYFKQLFLKLGEYYDIGIDGYFNITIYFDQNYGAILDVEKDSLDYFDCMDNEVEMSIQVVKNAFVLYQIEDPFLLNRRFLKRHQLFFYRGSYYVRLCHPVGRKGLYSLMECSQIIYGNITNNIVRYGQLVKL